MVEKTRKKCGQCVYFELQSEEVGTCNYDIPQIATVNKPGPNQYQADQTQVEAILPPVRLEKIACHHWEFEK